MAQNMVTVGSSQASQYLQALKADRLADRAEIVRVDQAIKSGAKRIDVPGDWAATVAADETIRARAMPSSDTFQAGIGPQSVKTAAASDQDLANTFSVRATLLGDGKVRVDMTRPMHFEVNSSTNATMRSMHLPDIKRMPGAAVSRTVDPATAEGRRIYERMMAPQFTQSVATLRAQQPTLSLEAAVKRVLGD